MIHWLTPNSRQIIFNEIYPDEEVREIFMILDGIRDEFFLTGSRFFRNLDNPYGSDWDFFATYNDNLVAYIEGFGFSINSAYRGDPTSTVVRTFQKHISTPQGTKTVKIDIQFIPPRMMEIKKLAQVYLKSQGWLRDTTERSVATRIWSDAIEILQANQAAGDKPKCTRILPSIMQTESSGTV